MDVIKVIPDKQKALSLLDMADIRLDLIRLAKKSDKEKYSSKIVEEYYEAVLELITAIMTADGYKTRSDLAGTHITSIEYLRTACKEMTEKEINIIDDLRQKRNGIKYQGRYVKRDYIDMYETEIKSLIGKLTILVRKRIKNREELVK